MANKVADGVISVRGLGSRACKLERVVVRSLLILFKVSNFGC